MATISVANASQLLSALGKANGGDVIQCASGNYGKVTINKAFSGEVKITSNGGAKFSEMLVTKAKNVTIDNVEFGGSSKSGIGLKVADSSSIKVLNSEFHHFQFGVAFSKVDNLLVQNNDVHDMWHDGMRFAAVTNTKVLNNNFHHMNSEPGYTHKDMIQVWTNAKNGEGPSKNMVIAGNKMDNPDGLTHGIFFSNPWAWSGDKSKFYQDITIENNYLRMSHVHGITIEHANGLDIKNNTLVPNKDAGKTAGVNQPLINVSPVSTDVDIIGNTAPSIPNKGNPTWTISGNNETGKDSLVHWLGRYDGPTNTTTVKNEGGSDGAGDWNGDDGDDAGGGSSDGGSGGGSGATVHSGPGANVLFGTSGDDRFVFDKVEDSKPWARDVIKGFDGVGQSGGDKIDVSAIDANQGKSGNQTFDWNDTGRGGISLVEKNGDTLVRLNVDSDKGFEFELLIDDGPGTKAWHYSAADFIL